jgi:hypothetical protein
MVLFGLLAAAIFNILAAAGGCCVVVGHHGLQADPSCHSSLSYV